MEVNRVTSLKADDVAGRDFSFQVSAVVSKPYDHLATDQDVKTTPVSPYSKTFQFEEEEVPQGKESEKAIFTLSKDGQVFGFATASSAWNNMVNVDYIALDVSVRGSGNGKRLLTAVVDWAREIDVKGVRIETQSNNVSACRFYRKFGLSFGGYDEFLYKGSAEYAQEEAHFWYQIF